MLKHKRNIKLARMPLPPPREWRMKKAEGRIPVHVKSGKWKVQNAGWRGRHAFGHVCPKGTGCGYESGASLPPSQDYGEASRHAPCSRTLARRRGLPVFAGAVALTTFNFM